MAKMTIYVPDGLKRRMDEAAAVNWSPLACRAFELKLAEIITAEGAKNMRDVIVRLRAEMAVDEVASKSRGRLLGESWAKNVARPAELKRLESLESIWWEDFPFGEMAQGIGELF